MPAVEPRTPAGVATPRLSICIATFRRAAFIGETLASILPQAGPEVEVLVLDGASPDDTAGVVSSLQADYPALRYLREATNSGVDQDYDKAVMAATGEYCWLMTDDDLLRPDAVARVLAALDGSVDLVVVNAEARNVDLSRVLQPRLLGFDQDRDYGAGDGARVLEDLAGHLKFIGAVVVRRQAWLARRREPYYGTLFVHAGVIFQQPALAAVRVLSDPLIIIRYGNAMWTARGFEIWMFKWPRLVWSFDHYSEASRRRVCAREPWRQLAKLGAHRALGAYSPAEYRTWLAGKAAAPALWLPWLIAHLPARFANLLAGLACLARPRKSMLNLYDLSRSRHSTAVTRWIARRLGA